MTEFGSSVYIFGGPAENEVSSFDLTDNELTQDLSGMSTPSGTYILALT